MINTASIRAAFSSPKAFVKAIQTEQDGRFSAENTGEKRQLSNIDLEPTPIHERTWNGKTFTAFWTAHAASAGAWTSGSATMTLGLPWWQTWISLNLAHVLITYLVVINGRGPARYHIGFPVMSRSAFGIWGSYIAVGMRCVVCVVWNGVNTFYGGKLVSVAISCIWPQWKTLPNALPASAGITSTGLASLFIFWAIFQAISFVHARDMKLFYHVKSVVVFIMMHVILIWIMVRTGGVSKKVGFGEKPLSAAANGWLFMQAFNAGLGVASSLTVNQGDIARYATSPKAQFLPQMITYPISSAIPCLYGILATTAIRNATGTTLWAIWDQLAWLETQYPDNRGARFVIFLAAASMALAYVGVNLATNCLPFGSDLSALFPKYFTIRRGQVLCCILGVAICPWKIITDAKSFLAFLSGYGYWLAPLAAVLATDYYLLKKGNIYIADLYTASPSGRYYYWRGFNVPALAATFLSLVPCLPSFGYQVSPSTVHIPLGAIRMFYISFPLTYLLSGMIYVGASRFLKVKGAPIFEDAAGFEAQADLNDELERQGLPIGGSADAAGAATPETDSEKEKVDGKAYVNSV